MDLDSDLDLDLEVLILSSCLVSFPFALPLPAGVESLFSFTGEEIRLGEGDLPLEPMMSINVWFEVNEKIQLSTLSF